MALEKPKRSAPVAALLAKVLTSARFLVDARGGKTDVVLSLPVWQNLLAMLEELEDREVVRQWLPKLSAGPAAADALRWEDVADEWNDGEEVPVADRA